MNAHRVRTTSSNARITLVLVILFGFLPLPAFSKTATLKHNSNLRKSASSSSDIIEELSAGTQVTLISNRKLGGYYHVQAQDGAAGWVWVRNVTVSAGGGASPTAAPPTGPSTGQGFDPGCALPFESIKQKHPVIDDSCSVDGTKRNGGNLSDSKL